MIASASDTEYYIDNESGYFENFEVFSSEISVATASDAYMREIVVDTCTKIQFFMLAVIIVAVTVTLYKFLKIFF